MSVLLFGEFYLSVFGFCNDLFGWFWYLLFMFEVMLDDKNMKSFFIPKSKKSIDHNTYC